MEIGRRLVKLEARYFNKSSLGSVCIDEIELVLLSGPSDKGNFLLIFWG